ncbi:redoxin domain-containing protein [Algoriphagus sp. SE2]|uniref:peroxiredoxin family protein n=1 Tax=Algoriphagus sp. SE2 TaxID=3141536 RepID=UPI0031CD10CC
MNKIYLIILFTVLLGSTAYLAVSSQKDNLTNESNQPAPRVLPDYTLSDMNGKPNSIHELAENKPTLFIYFNSTCHLCQEELGSLSKRIDEFKNYNIILTTVQPVEEMIGFANSLGIKDKSFVHFLLDTEMKVASYFQIRSVPSIFCYDSKKQLVAEYVGITEIDLLIEQLAKGK